MLLAWLMSFFPAAPDDLARCSKCHEPIANLIASATTDIAPVVCDQCFTLSKTRHPRTVSVHQSRMPLAVGPDQPGRVRATRRST